MRISAWCSDVCSSDLSEGARLTAIYERIYDMLVDQDPEFATALGLDNGDRAASKAKLADRSPAGIERGHDLYRTGLRELKTIDLAKLSGMDLVNYETFRGPWEHYVEAYDTFDYGRSEEHTSELQSLMRISYAVFCLKKTRRTFNTTNYNRH